jgi:outer membrane protein assembly factor BamA
MNKRRLLLAVLWLVLPVEPVSGQQQPAAATDSSSVEWYVETADTVSPIAGVQEYPVDSLSVVAHRLLRNLQERGYYWATIEGVDTTRSMDTRHMRFSVDRGPRAVIDRLQITGTTALDSTTIAALLETQAGQIARADRLEADIDRLLTRYEEIGYPLAQVSVREMDASEKSRRLSIVLKVDEGPAVVLAGIELLGAERTRASYVEQLLGLTPGRRLQPYKPGDIRRRLLATGLFESVGEPQLLLRNDREALLRIPVVEAPPGQFDFVLGYKPSSGGRGGQLVGHGFIDLYSVVGGGRRFRFEMDQMPGQVSETRAGIMLPFIFGTPLRTGIQFEGYQRDSTYGTRSVDVQLGYRTEGGFEISARANWRVVRPGTRGTNLSIRPSSTVSGGFGIHYREVDHRINPRRGWLFDLTLDHGRKKRRDTTGLVEQQRLESELRAYLPLFERQVVVLGYNAWVVRSPVYDQTDVYRIGGTRTLRGYDEEQFLTHRAVRGLAEYRLQVDRESYGFLFVESGYIMRPPFHATGDERSWRWGYGLGGQVQTNVGLVQLSYALNPRIGITNGRVHIGMRLGL